MFQPFRVFSKNGGFILSALKQGGQMSNVAARHLAPGRCPWQQQGIRVEGLHGEGAPGLSLHLQAAARSGAGV